MPDDVREAAERLRRIHNGEDHEVVYNGRERDLSDPDDPYVRDMRLALGDWLASHPASGPSDSELLDWLESRAFTAYRGRDPESGKLERHAVVVNEDAHRTFDGRRGILGPTLRDAIRKAMGGGK